MIDVFIVEDEEDSCLTGDQKVRLVDSAHSGEAALREIPLAKPEPKMLLIGH